MARFSDLNHAIDDMLSSVTQETNELVNIDGYVNVIGQNVCICKHEAKSYGNYHTHDCFEINYAHRGNCVNLIENNLIFMNTGDFLIMHPGTFHNLYAQDKSEIYNFLIRPKWFLNTFSQYPLKPSLVSTFIENSGKKNHYSYVICSHSEKEINTFNTAQKYAAELINKNSSQEAMRFFQMDSMTVELICALISEYEKPYLSPHHEAESKIVMQLLAYVTEHFKHVTLDDIAKALGYSKNHICRIFKNNMNKSFSDVVIEIRINHAKSYLINTELPIKEICFEIGYDSIEYFQRLFKAHTGYTPGAYRKAFKVISK